MSLSTIQGPLGIELEPEDATITSAAATAVGDCVMISFLAANLSGNKPATALAVVTAGFQGTEVVGLKWFGIALTSCTTAGQKIRVRLRGYVQANCAAAQTPSDTVVLLRPTNLAATLTIAAAGDQAAGTQTKCVAHPMETTSAAGLAWVYFNGIEGVQMIVGA